MHFIDPSTCQCTSCLIESTFPVRDLLALTANCPVCGASMSDTGLGMRRMADEFGSMYCVTTITMHVENRLSITIPDDPLLAIRSWDALTLNDISTVVQQRTSSHSSAEVDEAVLSAVRSEWPGAPKLLDYTLPLLDAVSPRRYSHGFWGTAHELKNHGS